MWSGEPLSVGVITLDPARHHVTVNGKAVRLTSVEFKLLSMLMLRRGRVQARDRLLNEVWGYESLIDTRTVDTHVRRLRRKLGKAADAIETVRGFGYRLRERLNHELDDYWRRNRRHPRYRLAAPALALDRTMA